MNLPEIALAAEALANDALGELPADLDTLAHLLIEARRAKRAISDVERAVEAAVAEAMPDKRVSVEGVGMLERKRGADRKAWDHERLGARIAALSRDERMMNFESGEVEDASDAAIRVFTTVAHVDYYRVGELKNRGLDVSEFCEEVPGRTSVMVMTPEPSASLPDRK